MTAAESFYASIQSPYQLLILGDPLCQPYATPPRFKLSGCKDRQSLTDKIALEFLPSEEDNSCDSVQLTWLIDGKIQTQTNFLTKLNIDVAPEDRGAYEWRFITKGPKPIETRWEKSLWVLAGPEETHVSLDAPKRWSRKDSPVLKLKVPKIPEGTQIRLRFHWNTLEAQHDAQGQFELDPNLLGSGPIRLQPLVCDLDGNVLYAGLPSKIYIED